MTRAERKAEIRLQIRALQAQWPAHGVAAGLLEQLEDLERELERLEDEETGAPEDHSS